MKNLCKLFFVVIATVALSACGTMSDQAARTAEEVCAGVQVKEDYQFCFQDVYQRDYARRAQAQAMLLGAMNSVPTSPPPSRQINCMSGGGGTGIVYTRCQ